MYPSSSVDVAMMRKNEYCNSIGPYHLATEPAVQSIIGYGLTDLFVLCCNGFYVWWQMSINVFHKRNYFVFVPTKYKPYSWCQEYITILKDLGEILQSWLYL